jgi:hypothetical protein
LAEAVSELLHASEGDGSREDVLLIQGLVLEHLGITLYEAVAQGGRLSQQGNRAAAVAKRASTEVTRLAGEALTLRYPDPEERFQAFASRTNAIFARLDTLGEAIDASFAEPMGIRFADLMGDFVAELLPTCTKELGFERRKVMMHLTSAMMG